MSTSTIWYGGLQRGPPSAARPRQWRPNPIIASAPLSKPGVFWPAGICYGTAMRRGGAILQAAFAGSLLLVTSCGSKTPPAATPVTSNGPTAGTNGVGGTTPTLSTTAGTSGTTAELPLAHPETAYPDPSKLLLSRGTDQNTDAEASPTLQQASAPRSGLMLEVLERGPNQPWTIQIVNRGDQPAE